MIIAIILILLLLYGLFFHSIYVSEYHIETKANPKHWEVGEVVYPDEKPQYIAKYKSASGTWRYVQSNWTVEPVHFKKKAKACASASQHAYSHDLRRERETALEKAKIVSCDSSGS